MLPLGAFLVAAGAVFFLVPIAGCGGCLKLRTITWSEFLHGLGDPAGKGLAAMNPNMAADTIVARCTWCEGKGRKTLAEHWLKPSPCEMYVLSNDGGLETLREPQLRRILDRRPR